MSILRKTIFLVDDNKTNLIIGSNTLSKAYKVFTMNSGERMFAALEKITPDLILLDIEMPDINGYEVLERLKSNKKTENIPVIFLTALISEENELKGLSMGALDYVRKPFSPSLLLKRVELHLSLIDYNSNLERMVQSRTRDIRALKNAILRTTAELMERRDFTIGNHIERTQQYMKILFDAAKNFGVYSSEILALDESLVLQSSQLHDVGKISISDSILLKPGKLTPEEFDIIKLHTTFGESIIEDIKRNLSLEGSGDENDFLEYAKILTASHHERWDGSGYPLGLKGEEIPLLGRILAIADVYDALVSVRPYKAAFSHSDAKAIIIEGENSHFDPALIYLFKKVHDDFVQISASKK